MIVRQQAPYIGVFARNQIIQKTAKTHTHILLSGILHSYKRCQEKKITANRNEPCELHEQEGEGGLGFIWGVAEARRAGA
jgi:hypothetical protein